MQVIISYLHKWDRNRVESGSDDPEYLGHLDHFFGGSSGSYLQLNYLDVTRIFDRSYVL